MNGLITAIVNFSQAHQSLAYGLVFVLAMAEAVPVIGALVPGSGIIIGISALIPSGAVGLWPMIISATFGAIVGDGFSYWLGHNYHRAIVNRWPLNHYPLLLERGEAFFRRHGRKSVFIARFTPGVRAVVPVVAGILRMSPARFYRMNVLSAFVWAPSHVLAGALIGASLALLGAVAGRLAVLAVILGAMLWAAVWAVRYTVHHLPDLTRRLQDSLSAWAQARDTWISRQVLSVLDPSRRELSSLAFLGAILVGGLWLFLGVLEDVISGDPLVRADVAVFHFLESLRNAWVDNFMVAITELGDGAVTLAVTAVVLLWLAIVRAWRACAYMAACVTVAGLFTLLLKVTLHRPRPVSIAEGWDAFSFPSGHTTVNAALYSFAAILIAWALAAKWRVIVAIAATILVTAIAFSRLYLGAHWISDVLAGGAFGVAWAALLGIAYFRRSPPLLQTPVLGGVVASTLLVVGGVHVDNSHAADMIRYAVRESGQSMAQDMWWQKGWSELPLRRIDLIGDYEEPFTLQWAGNLDALRKSLVAKGWRSPTPWTVRSAFVWLTPHVSLKELPVLPRLDNGHREVLVLVHPESDTPDRARLVLRLWRSNVSLTQDATTSVPVWIGTVVEEHAVRVAGVLTLTHERREFTKALNVLAADIPSARHVVREMARCGKGWDCGVVLAHAPNVRMAYSRFDGCPGAPLTALLSTTDVRSVV